MKENPLITIAISAYNVEKYIEKSLLFALNQDYPNLEILVIDNVSSDGTVCLARKIAGSHQRGDCVRIIQHTENKQLSGSRNTGIDSAKGEFLMFLDADDFIEPSAVTSLYNLIENHGADFSFASFATIDENGGILVREVFKDSYCCDRFAFEDFAKRNVARFPVMMWNKLYRLDFLKKNNIKCLPGSTVDDVYFTFRVLYHAKSYVCTQDIFYYYLIRQDSITRSYKHVDFESLIHTNEQINDFIHSHDDVPLSVFEYFVGYLSFFIGQLSRSNNPISYKMGILKRIGAAIPEYCLRLGTLSCFKYRLLLLMLKHGTYLSIILMYNVKLVFRKLV